MTLIVLVFFKNGWLLQYILGTLASKNGFLLIFFRHWWSNFSLIRKKWCSHHWTFQLYYLFIALLWGLRIFLCSEPKIRSRHRIWKPKDLTIWNILIFFRIKLKASSLQRYLESHIWTSRTITMLHIWTTCFRLG